jgi:acyl-CoA carboxylase epsilon subunit
VSAPRSCAKNLAPATFSAHDPLVRIVRGEPDDVEVAALAVVLAVLAASPPPTDPMRAASQWVDHAGHLRHPLRVGPHAWRMSVWPS